MKIKVRNENFTGEHIGFSFKNGVAEISKEDEGKAKRIAKHLGYEIIEEKKAAPKKSTAKKTTTKKTTKKDEDKK